MKLTKTQIILASAGAVIGGAAILFGLTKTGKGLIKKWFGKEETTEPAGDTQIDTVKSDTIPPEDKGIVAPKPKTETAPPKTELKRAFPILKGASGREVESVQMALNKFFKFTLPITKEMNNDTINALTSQGYTMPLSKQQFNRLRVGLK